jgi:protein farnesyltransferase/geranylgeranyltransferase type-1 subunit alpha
MALKSPLDVDHRRLIVTQTREPAPELAFIGKSLEVDSKNYHTWSYRQWLLAYFNDDKLWSGELEFVEAKLKSDLRNNSAWHHRFFVTFQSGIRTGEEDRDATVKRELRYLALLAFSFYTY